MVRKALQRCLHFAVLMIAAGSSPAAASGASTPIFVQPLGGAAWWYWATELRARPDGSQIVLGERSSADGVFSQMQGESASFMRRGPNLSPTDLNFAFDVTSGRAETANGGIGVLSQGSLLAGSRMSVLTEATAVQSIAVDLPAGYDRLVVTPSYRLAADHIYFTTSAVGPTLVNFDAGALAHVAILGTRQENDKTISEFSLAQWGPYDFSFGAKSDDEYLRPLFGSEPVRADEALVSVWSTVYTDLYWWADPGRNALDPSQSSVVEADTRIYLVLDAVTVALLPIGFDPNARQRALSTLEFTYTFDSFRPALGSLPVVGLDGVSFQVSPVPEPSTWATWLAGLLGVSLIIRLRRRCDTTATTCSGFSLVPTIRAGRDRS